MQLLMLLKTGKVGGNRPTLKYNQTYDFYANVV